MRQRYLAPLIEPGIDAMRGTEIGDPPDCLLHRRIEMAGIGEAIGLDQRAIAPLMAADAGKAAIAAGSTPAGFSRFEHPHIHPIFASEAKGSGQPGIACAYDGDIALDIAGQGSSVDAEGLGGRLPVARNRVVKMKGIAVGCARHVRLLVVGWPQLAYH